MCNLLVALKGILAVRSRFWHFSTAVGLWDQRLPFSQLEMKLHVTNTMLWLVS